MKNILITIILMGVCGSFYVFSLTWVGELIWFGTMAIVARALYRLDQRIRAHFELLEILQSAGIHVED